MRIQAIIRYGEILIRRKSASNDITILENTN